MKAIHVENISKSYLNGKEKLEALKPLSFDVDKGELFGFIGPDGAGKTTLFRILTTLILADSGKAFVEGLDVVNDYQKIRQQVGYMPGRFSLYQDLSVEENLEFFATIFNTSVKENYHLIKDIYEQLVPFANRPAGKLSGGMKQKLALCCALIHKPTVLFLDEPTTGVDAVSRKEFWEMLKRLKSQGITILVSTPYMDEASLCDRVALMQEGKFLSTDAPANIIKNYSKTLLAVKGANMFPLLQKLKTIQGIKSAYPFGEFHHIVLEDRILNIEKLKIELHEYDHLEIKEAQADIEDCFIYAMQNQ